MHTFIAICITKKVKDTIKLKRMKCYFSINTQCRGYQTNFEVAAPSAKRHAAIKKVTVQTLSGFSVFNTQANIII